MYFGGPLAQLVECLGRIEEVSGSIPLRSTTKMPEKSAPQNLWSSVEGNFRPLVLILSGLFLFGSGMLLAKAWQFRNPPPIKYEVESSSEVANVVEDSETLLKVGLIKVDVSGAVKNPGVCELKDGSRVEDVINCADGFSDEVDQEWIARSLNLAARISDGEKLYIPKEGEVAGAASTGQAVGSGGGEAQAMPSSAAREPTKGKININTASKSDLESLPGIGPVYAQRIIDYRLGNPFDSIEETMEIKGIGEKTFEKIKDLIVVR